MNHLEQHREKRKVMKKINYRYGDTIMTRFYIERMGVDICSQVRGVIKQKQI